MQSDHATATFDIADANRPEKFPSQISLTIARVAFGSGPGSGAAVLAASLIEIDHLVNFQPFPSTINNMSTSAQISKKRKFVADGVFQAELGEFL